MELLELRAQLANFEAPARHPEPVTDSEDSEDEHEGQLQAWLQVPLESEEMCVYLVDLTQN